METIEIANGMIYSSYKIAKKILSNHENCLWSEAIDYHHCCFMNLGLNSFPYSSLISPQTSLDMSPIISLFSKIFLDVPIWVLPILGTHFLEAICSRYLLGSCIDVRFN